MKRFKDYFSIVSRSIHQLWIQYHFLVPFSKLKEYFSLFASRMSAQTPITVFSPNNQEEYLKWIQKNERFEEETILSYVPKFSVIIPVYNINRFYLSECLESILGQTYKNYEICLADDKSTCSETIKTLKEYQKKYNNIKVCFREKNGNISAASNSALSIATGDFVILMDDDDTISKQAMYKIAKALNYDNDIDFIYTDEDKIDEKGNRCTPHFKSNWAPDSMLSINYVSHLTIIRRSILNSIGGFNSDMDGAQDYDVEWRAIENSRKVYHIPEILYHWRMINGSTATLFKNKNYVQDKGKHVLEAKLSRSNLTGIVSKIEDFADYQIIYSYINQPHIETIIYNYDDSTDLENCAKSFIKYTDYINYRINILVDQKDKDNISELINQYRIISQIEELFISDSNDTLYLFIDAHTRFNNKNWLSILVGQSLQEHVGFCGPKITDLQNLIRHYGIVGGINDYFEYMYDGINSYETGYYGKLICTTDVLSLAPDCLLVSGKKLMKAKPLMKKYGMQMGLIDLNLQLMDLGFYNVIVPNAKVSTVYKIQKPLIKNISTDFECFSNKWSNYIDNDPFYNQNLSSEKPFYLDK